MSKQKSSPAVAPSVRRATNALLPQGHATMRRSVATAAIRAQNPENDTEHASDESAAWWASLSRQEQENCWAARFGRAPRKFGLKMEEGSNGGEGGHYQSAAQCPVDHFTRPGKKYEPQF